MRARAYTLETDGAVAKREEAELNLILSQSLLPTLSHDTTHAYLHCAYIQTCRGRAGGPSPSPSRVQAVVHVQCDSSQKGLVFLCLILSASTCIYYERNSDGILQLSNFLRRDLSAGEEGLSLAAALDRILLYDISLLQLRSRSRPQL